MQFPVIAVTDPHTNKPTNTQKTNPQTGPITIHCATKLSMQCYYVPDVTKILYCPVSFRDHWI